MAPKKISKFIRFSTMAFQMGATIALFTWLGTYLDKKYQLNPPWWTIGLSLFGVTAALVLAIRDVIKMGKEGEE